MLPSENDIHLLPISPPEPPQIRPSHHRRTLSSLCAKPPPTAPLSPSLLLNHRRPLHHRRPQRSTISTFYRFGRIYEQGHYPQWDEDHPLHFVGHLAGAQVVRVLQQMLADKAFRGYEDTSENWVLSIPSLSGAFNGTTRAYLDGIELICQKTAELIWRDRVVTPEGGRSMKPICLLQLLRLGVIVYDWLDIRWIKAYCNFGFDHFNMSWKNIGVWGLADCLMGNTGPFASGDWILPDLTIQGSMRLNSHLRTFPDTFYFSYATKRTTRIAGITIPSGILRPHPLLLR
ncbi:hypothetical protein Vadar_033670 [Vaccinium darrowii]|uniref:Uncharacterized protein n=1 Tax=Vaccinium darrowii TaxID=229202 RepID=A0ACB7Z7W7_9ERIC|nr:hypothetical protein Vadar_033670 [Vaccinium darrowii]